MSHTCIASQTHHDVRCPICGSGFLLLATPDQPFHSGSLRRAARKALAAQHEPFPREQEKGSTLIHPDGAFDLPGFDSHSDSDSSGWDVPAWVRAYSH